MARVADRAVHSPWSEVTEAQSEGSALLSVTAGLSNCVPRTNKAEQQTWPVQHTDLPHAHMVLTPLLIAFFYLLTLAPGQTTFSGLSSFP